LTEINLYEAPLEEREVRGNQKGTLEEREGMGAETRAQFLGLAFSLG
jgi:hypothetical protein